jgi:hypothetical protein
MSMYQFTSQVFLRKEVPVALYLYIFLLFIPLKWSGNNTFPHLLMVKHRGALHLITFYGYVIIPKWQFMIS